MLILFLALWDYQSDHCSAFAGLKVLVVAPCLCPMSLPLVSAPCLCPLSLPLVSTTLAPLNAPLLTVERGQHQRIKRTSYRAKIMLVFCLCTFWKFP